jgi:hypothetical protein
LEERKMKTFTKFSIMLLIMFLLLPFTSPPLFAWDKEVQTDTPTFNLQDVPANETVRVEYEGQYGVLETDINSATPWVPLGQTTAMGGWLVTPVDLTGHGLGDVGVFYVNVRYRLAYDNGDGTFEVKDWCSPAVVRVNVRPACGSFSAGNN